MNLKQVKIELKIRKTGKRKVFAIDDGFSDAKWFLENG